MSTFRYVARSTAGGVVEGQLDAHDRPAAIGMLADQGLFPSRLEATAAVAAPSPADLAAPRGALDPLAKSARARGARRIARREVTAFTRELAALLSAAIPIPSALEGLGSEDENPAMRDTILAMAGAVRHGRSLSQAMEEFPRLFPPLYTSMVEVGEESGALDKVMADLADLLEREDELRGEIAGAVAYPLFVLGLGVVTTFILLAFVLPRLFGMLQGMAAALPLPTRILLGTSEIVRAHWHWMVLAVVAAAIAAAAWIRTPEGALRWDALKLRLPLIGPLVRAAALARFARTLGTLAHAGVSLLPALRIVENTVGNRFLARLIARAAEETRGGDSLAAPLRKAGLFPPTMVQMIAVGEETGRLADMLVRVAAMEERQARGRSRTLISLLAPALILVVGALVGFIVIALLLPIFRMSQSIR